RRRVVDLFELCLWHGRAAVGLGGERRSSLRLRPHQPGPRLPRRRLRRAPRPTPARPIPERASPAREGVIPPSGQPTATWPRSLLTSWLALRVRARLTRGRE